MGRALGDPVREGVVELALGEMEHEHTEFVAASPEGVFGALADVGNLPR